MIGRRQPLLVTYPGELRSGTVSIGMKSMKLYDHVGRVEAELRAAGHADGASIRVADVAPFDSLHYHGNAAVDVAIAVLEIGADARVLDVGSGLGGPARHVAASTGCAVVALELQEDLHLAASDLTRRCGLDGRVRHVRGDILDGPPSPGGFDALISYLVFLHIPDRSGLLHACCDALVTGGRIYIEDFTLLTEPGSEGWAALRTKVMCSYLPTPETYGRQLRDAGFGEVVIEDLTADWTAFTAERLAIFRKRRARHVEIHGELVTADLEDFYATVAGLYADGVLGGARITATRV